MKKQTKASQAEANMWDDSNDPIQAAPTAEEIVEVAQTVAASIKPTNIPAALAGEYELEGLMTDFPTAKELERFVYDETGVILNLKGRSNAIKYQVAMDVLNGKDVDPKFIGDNNPYIEKAEMVPQEELKPIPARDKDLPPANQLQNSFVTFTAPHPDPEQRAMDKKVHIQFRKYKTGEISYEVLGPLETYPYGEKIDKYGRSRPEIIKWINPRTGEQMLQRADGTLTPQGKRLRAMMQTYKVNKSNQWDVWVDREFISLNDSVANNPWDISK